jgi:2-polyprenyl-3-methyl-5-hydroxy-6-metoxy-1,4-benzoquinol methylase
MKILVVVCSYGTKNDVHLEKVLEEYRSMPYDIDIILLSNIQKDFGPDIEVVTAMPTSNPHSLPFAHKQIFADRADLYDLFVFTEDDIIITARNIEAFMEATRKLPSDRIAGFTTYEVYPDGSKNFQSAHHRHHWVPDSVEKAGGDVFAHFTNTHAACYLFTNEHLKKAIASGGFLVDPPKDKEGTLQEINNTQPYMQCGFIKVIGISRLDDFLVRHMTNAYLGRLGTSELDFNLQVNALLQIAEGKLPAESICMPAKNEPFTRWDKNYHEQGGEEVINSIPLNAKKMLNVGGVMGIVEAALLSRGMEVVSIPIDSVVAQCLEAKGVRTTPANFRKAFDALVEDRFDCIMMINIIQHLKEPVEVLSGLRKLLSPDGCIILVAPKINSIKTWIKAIPRRRNWWRPLSFDEMQMHMTSGRLLGKWVELSGLKIKAIIPSSDRKKIIMRCGLS